MYLDNALVFRAGVLEYQEEAAVNGGTMEWKGARVAQARDGIMVGRAEVFLLVHVEAFDSKKWQRK